MGVFTRVFATARRKYTISALIAVVVVGASSFTLMRADAGTTFTTVQPGTFAGSAFDACAAPSSASMKAWRASSPYKAVGIYIGGVSRGCAQPNLTAAWVKEQVQAGWKLLPLYVGPQAGCTGAKNRKNVIDNASADAMGRAAASDATAQAASLGLARNSVIIYDLEAYATNDAACRKGVLAFLNGWTARLHDNGYLSGFYSSAGSGVADQVANYSVVGYSRPDYVDFARWDLKATVTDAAIPPGAWPGHRRMKQYQGGHKETYGGVTINIDSNIVDFAPLPAAKFADFTGNGWSDVIGRSTAGALSSYPGNGANINAGARRTIGASGWNSMNAIVRIGDLNRDGKEDVVARQTNGYLWFYPGTTTGFGSRKKLATGWKPLREITAIGDLNQDGYPDLLAISAGNNLYLYPGLKGTKLGKAKLIGSGWAGKGELFGAGDFNRDGVVDLGARQTATGAVLLYTGKKGGLSGNRLALGTFGGDYRDFVGVGDFDRDGYVDAAVVQKSTGALLLLPGQGSRLLPARRLATGFGGVSALA